MRLREVGIQSRETDKIYTKRPSCAASAQNQIFEVTAFDDCDVVIYIFIYGLILSFIILILELLVYTFEMRSFKWIE